MSKYLDLESKKSKILVALSGGVDSAATAALLKKQGYEVTGIFMRLFSGRNDSELVVKQIAQKLGIDIRVANFSLQFQKLVERYFFREYLMGRTPNPCVVCNEKIKFGLLLKEARKMKAEFLATGHYARIKKTKGFFRLFRAQDKEKDQSYFLYRLGQEELSRVIFPLGEYTKKDVLELAKKWHLPFQKKSSADACFMLGQKLEDFLKRRIKLKPGIIIDEKGKFLGYHKGLPLYTIGQRASVGGPGPFYVIGKNLKENQLIVSSQKEKLFKKDLKIEEVSWVSSQQLILPKKCWIKIRYRTQEAEAKILSYKKERKEAVIEFKHPQRAITSGQSAVFYSLKGEVLGGGIIK